MPSIDRIKPTIIGVYGISGSGKSYLLNQLKTDTTLKERHFAFYDSSELINSHVEGGITTFHKGSLIQQNMWRKQVLSRLVTRCRATKKTAVVAGHYLLWETVTDPAGEIVAVNKDWETYTHMIYLDVSPEVVKGRRQADKKRLRVDHPVEHLKKWQDKERFDLRDLCWTCGILFTTISENASSIGSITVLKLKTILKDFQQHTEEENLSAVEIALDNALGNQDRLEKVLVLDADKTLAPQDTGSLFWKELVCHSDFSKNPLKVLFDSRGYSYASFRQATFLYEEVAAVFDTLCEETAAKVEMYPKMKALLIRGAKEPHVGAIVVTCGLHVVWEKVLKRNSMSHVKVIGGGRIEDGFVVTGPVKRHVVDKLHESKLQVHAFGNGPLDIEMFKKADRAYVVVGEKETRSKSMDTKLDNAIKAGLKACQIILPGTAEPRLDFAKLPKFQLDDANLSLVFKRPFLHATNKNIGQLLQTPTPDARIAGHEVREAHERIGYYLATEYLSDLLGVEQHEIPHVQGRSTDGYRFKDEAATLIVPLMRGGEPMASGVSKAFKLASFAHAYEYRDIKKGNLEGKRTIILVDSVINSGGSIMDFLVPLREEHPFVRVNVVAGVVQAKAVKTTDFAKMLESDQDLMLVALRTSDNSYKGTKGTNTGHRLFGTTNLE